MFSDLTHLAGTIYSSLLLVPAAIPIWDSYVNAIEHSLDFLARTVHSAGLAVVIFTILIKILLLPLTVKSTKSSKAMQEIQPKIKELQKKHGKDRAKIQQETMALYQAHRVNPLAGCLPMLIQIPIFFGLYRAILHLSEGGGPENASMLWGQSFLWISNLASADPLHILPFLAGAFQFVQTRMSRPAGQGKPSDPQQAMMNTMMNFMPLMVIFFGWGFAAGPVLYWATQSIFSVVQQWMITGWGALLDWFPRLPDLPEHRRLGYAPPRPIDDVVVVSGEPVRPAGFMGWMNTRMEEAKAQQAAKAGGTAASPEVVVTGKGKGASSKGPATTPEPIEVEITESERNERASDYEKRVTAAMRKRTSESAVPEDAKPSRKRGR